MDHRRPPSKPWITNHYQRLHSGNHDQSGRTVVNGGVRWPPWPLIWYGNVPYTICTKCKQIRWSKNTPAKTRPQNNHLAKIRKPCYTVLMRFDHHELQRITRHIHVPADPSKCWHWQGRRDRDGYGQFRTGEGETGPHRWVYQYVNGCRLPRHILVCHRCDQPACCNPSHLWAGTNQQNATDRNSKGRQSRKLSDEDVASIRADQRTAREIAHDYAIHPNYVSELRCRKYRTRTW